MKENIQLSKKIARDIIKEYKITKPPVDVDDIVKKISQNKKISILLESHNFIDKVSGAHISKGEKHLIAYNSGHHPHRQRFTIAHELGHLLLEHADIKNDGDDFNSKSPEEAAANSFAAELLVPLSFLKKDFDNNIKDVKVLADRYKVSEEMMWWRIIGSGFLKKI